MSVPLDKQVQTHYIKCIETTQEGKHMREATNKILEMIEEGILGQDEVIMAALKYMSEDDVKDMARVNEFFYYEEEAV